MIALTLNILILDDHELIAYGIKSKLEKLLPNAEFDVYTKGEVVNRKSKDKKYDLYIVDLELQDTSGFDVVKKIRKLYPKSNIIVCTLHEEIWFVKELNALHVNGILFKSSCLDLLDKAVSKVINGEDFFCEKYKELTNSKEKDYHYLLNEMFTKNEIDVLNMVCKGYTIKVIAENKSWSVKTVEYYRKRLFDKFGVSNSSRLIAVAIKEGFIKKGDI